MYICILIIFNLFRMSGHTTSTVVPFSNPQIEIECDSEIEEELLYEVTRIWGFEGVRFEDGSEHFESPHNKYCAIEEFLTDAAYRICDWDETLTKRMSASKEVESLEALRYFRDVENGGWGSGRAFDVPFSIKPDERPHLSVRYEDYFGLRIIDEILCIESRLEALTGYEKMYIEPIRLDAIQQRNLASFVHYYLKPFTHSGVRNLTFFASKNNSFHTIPYSERSLTLFEIFDKAQQAIDANRRYKDLGCFLKGGITEYKTKIEPVRDLYDRIRNSQEGSELRLLYNLTQEYNKDPDKFADYDRLIELVLAIKTYEENIENIFRSYEASKFPEKYFTPMCELTHRSFKTEKMKYLESERHQLRSESQIWRRAFEQTKEDPVNGSSTSLPLAITPPRSSFATTSSSSHLSPLLTQTHFPLIATPQSTVTTPRYTSATTSSSSHFSPVSTPTLFLLTDTSPDGLIDHQSLALELGIDYNYPQNYAPISWDVDEE